MTDVLPPTAADGDPPSPGDTARSRSQRSAAAAGRRVDGARVVGLAVAVAASLFVLSQLHPRLLVTDTTPAGGDMGAHVWGPAYLRDHLLPSGRLSGWTPDWYSGFPAYHFYMVIPPLVIVALNAGLSPWLGLPLAAVVVGGAWRAVRHRPRLRSWVLAMAAIVAVSLVALPYGVAFKLVTVSGLLALPLVAWALGRLLRAPEPVPPLLALATLPFLFDTNFTIYGGNIASTLAGEFSFAISLALGLLAVGVVGRGMDTGRHRALAAVLLGLAGLCHVIPVFYVVVACLLLIGLARDVPRSWWVLLGASAALVPVGLNPGSSSVVRYVLLAQLVVVAGLLIGSQAEVRRRFTWLLPTGIIAVLLAAFWMLPFVAREPFMNHMGWERLEAVGDALLTTPMRLALPVAAVGFALALAQRVRLGVLLGVLALVSASTAANMPETRLWNARVLPFFYLSVYLLAALGLALVARACADGLAERATRPHARVLLVTPVVALVATLVAVGMPLRALPFGTTNPDGSYSWLVFSSRSPSFVPGWAAWNYSGYERKPAYREYHGIVSAMGEVGADRGCGRASWEYDSDLDRYGTPMALMLLPFWTDGCIGSMEGLYFESSGTTPFHFLNSSVLSLNPSRPQRDLPYRQFDAGTGFDLGVEQLQTLGVRYYLAMSDETIAAASTHPALTEVAASPPWVVYEVADSELVEPVSHLPVVVGGATIVNAVEADRFRTGWLGEAVRLFNDPTAPDDLLPAESGPPEWPRAELVRASDAVPVEPVVVSDIEEGTHHLSFRVDRPGVPVLVKASYFPNWSVSGGDGPWRVGPNLMAVVPTSQEVTLEYGSTPVEWAAWGLTLAGLAGLVGLQRLDRRRREPGVHPAGGTSGDGGGGGGGPDGAPAGGNGWGGLDAGRPWAGPIPATSGEAGTAAAGVVEGDVEVEVEGAPGRPVGGPDVSVVMPAYNEEALLEAAVTEVVEGLRHRDLDFELTVVENGSTDGTRRVADQLAARHPEVSVLSLDDADYGRALRAGLLSATGVDVVNFDVDYYDLDFLDAALAELGSSGGPHVVVGTKRGEGARDTRAWHRRVVTATYSAVLRRGFGLRVSDTHGIKAMRRRPLAGLAPSCRMGRDLFDTELILRAERAGLRTAEIPVVVVERRPSRTSILRRLPRTLTGLVRLRLALQAEHPPAATRRDGAEAPTEAAAG